MPVCPLQYRGTIKSAAVEKPCAIMVMMAPCIPCSLKVYTPSRMKPMWAMELYEQIRSLFETPSESLPTYDEVRHSPPPAPVRWTIRASVKAEWLCSGLQLQLPIRRFDSDSSLHTPLNSVVRCVALAPTRRTEETDEGASEMTDAQAMNNPLDRITVKGFRSIAHVEKLELTPINVLIGANGSGKSNFVDVFSLLRCWAEDRLNGYVGRSGGADRNLHFGAKTTPELYVQLSFAEGERHDIHLAATEADQLRVMSESVGGPPAASYVKEPQNADIKTFTRSRLKRWRVYHFHDTGKGAPILCNAELDDNRFLREDGGNLAAFLYFLREKEPSSYRRIKKTFRLVAPFFDDFVLEPLALNDRMIRIEWRHRTSEKHFDVSTLSDGSLRFLALTTLLLQPAGLRPSVILLDEPELGLHPYAVSALCSLIQSVAAETQVILATQSPYLVDHFEPEDIVVVDRVAGQSRFSRLAPEQLEEWLEDYSLGDLWLKNELGGRPAYESAVRSGG